MTYEKYWESVQDGWRGGEGYVVRKWGTVNLPLPEVVVQPVPGGQLASANNKHIHHDM